MFSISRVDDDDDDLSPVIAVILMVAVTVIVSAVIGSFVLDLGGSISANPQAGVTFSQDGTDVTVQVVSMENADHIDVRNGGSETELSQVGGSTLVDTAASGDSQITVVGTLDGKEAVLQTYDAS